MPTDDNKSLSDEATYTGGAKHPPKEEQSLGDRSTLGGNDGSSISDLGSIGELPDHDMEIVDLSKRYRIEKSLGRGGMGEVLLATDTRLDRQVAIKRIRADIAVGNTAAARFLQEAKAVAALSHPNIVSVHDYGRDADGPFLIMEYVSGGSLLQRCKEGPIELQQAVDLACQLCDGLGRAHDAGIIHRDIKPANILLTNDGIPKLTDFGLAKADSRDHTMTMAGAVLGTLDFMPPEQRQDASLTDSRSDLWSLAASLYQMVTGESPKVIRLKRVPDQIRDVLDKALEESKDERFQTAIALRDALKASLHSSGTDISDIGEGECPQCRTKNDSTRKFCRSCAGALEAPCLSCSVGMPMWENVCGSCGAKQEDLLQERREAMEASKLQAEDLSADYQYAVATRIAEELGSERDLRLQHLKPWSDRFIADCEKQRQRELARTGDLLGEALLHEKAHDYPSGIKALEQVPDALQAEQISGQNETIAAVLSRLRGTQSECEQLHQVIRTRVKSRQLNGLLDEVDKLRELIPQREDLKKLQDQLIKRHEKMQQVRQASFQKALEAMDSQDYQKCLAALSRIDPYVENDEICDLREEAEQKQQRLTELQDHIRTSIAQKQYDGLLDDVIECLALREGNDELEKLRGQLMKRSEEQESANRQKALLKRIWIGVASAAVAVLLVIAVMWQMSVQRANQLASALEGQRWEEVLAMEPENVTALIGRANQKLVSDNPDLDWILSEVDTIKSLDPVNPAVNTISGAVYALRSIAASGAGDVSTGETRLREAQSLNVDAVYLDRADKSLALAYAKRAETAVAAGNVTAAIAEASKATSFDTELVLPATVTVAIAESRASEMVSVYEADPNDTNRDAAKESLTALEGLNTQSTVLVSLRSKMQSIEIALAESRAREMVSAYETDPRYSNRDAAVLSLRALEGLDPKSVTLVNMRRKNSIKIAELMFGLEEAIMRQAFDGLEADYQELSKLDSASAARITDILSTLPPSELSILPLSVLSTLPPSVLSTLPLSVLSTLPPSVLSTLPPSVTAQLPPTKNSIGMRLKLLPAGTFIMDKALYAHQVTLTKPFMMGVHEVTQEQYVEVMGSNPNIFKGSQNPVENVSWDDAINFCRKLSALPEERAAGRVYRLPTEAEWEYACRAGTSTEYSFGDDKSDLGEYAWYDHNSGNQTHPVGEKQPNAFGLYDMHGNVWEWCADLYEAYPTGSVDPTGARSGSNLVVRGGGWSSLAEGCRSAFRNAADPSFRLSNYGFRVVCVPSSQ